MPISLGKKFEARFKEDILRQKFFIYRLPDQMTGNKITSANPCDFFVYCKPYLRLIECKSIHGNTFPLNNFTQYDKMLSYVKNTDATGAIIIWFIDKDIVLYIPIETITELKKENKKSININKLEELKNKYINVKSEKKKIFLQSDYQFLKEEIKFD